MTSLRYLLFSLLFTSALAAEDVDLRIIAVVGTSGAEEYGEVFAEAAAKWKEAAARGNAEFLLIGIEETVEEAEAHSSENPTTDRDRLRTAIRETTSSELWLVLIGHGTFDSRSVKFNLHGPDFTDEELADWLKEYPGELAVINTASASGSFVSRLSGPDRVVITATKNEAEVFYTRFGRYFAEAVGGLPEADLDNDDQVSLLEGFLHASDKVATFYKEEGRLATEHALVDDNGDRAGSRSEWFRGTTATRSPGPDFQVDGERAAQKVLVKNEFERRLSAKQRVRRDELERAVKKLRRERSQLTEDDYYGQLEPLLLELAEIYRAVGDS
ncbi:MAG: hypothetical protein AAGC68_07775 [Verrucomicrobiota bacterium]